MAAKRCSSFADDEDRLLNLRIAIAAATINFVP
jgi:hypothetical protein